jgi:hypothetical protein
VLVEGGQPEQFSCLLGWACDAHGPMLPAQPVSGLGQETQPARVDEADPAKVEHNVRRVVAIEEAAQQRDTRDVDLALGLDDQPAPEPIATGAQGWRRTTVESAMDVPSLDGHISWP